VFRLQPCVIASFVQIEEGTHKPSSVIDAKWCCRQAHRDSNHVVRHRPTGTAAVAEIKMVVVEAGQGHFGRRGLLLQRQQPRE
jgi:hypothetical protein